MALIEIVAMYRSAAGDSEFDHEAGRHAPARTQSYAASLDTRPSVPGEEWADQESAR